MTKRKDSAKRPMSGIVVVLVLGMIFAALMFGIMTLGSRQPPERGVAKVYYVISPTLKIRTQPKANAPVLETVNREARVEILEESGIWVQVRSVQGSIGWAERSQIAGQKEYERRMARARAIQKLPSLEGYVTERTALYAGPGYFYPIVGQVGTESKVRVYTRDHDFYAIDYSGTIAYAEVDAVQLAPQPSEELEIAAVEAEETGPSFERGTDDGVAPPLSEWTTLVVEPDPIGVYPAVPAGGTQPQVVRRVNPSYPRAARSNGIEGIVVIRAIVRRDGRADEVEILRDLPMGLGAAARDAVSQWRFLPATYKGEPIDVYYSVTVRFTLRGS